MLLEDELDKVTEEPAARVRMPIPYHPRKHFLPLHTSTKRFQFVCAHRRAGKSVAEFNHLLRAAALNKRQFPPPRYAYVGPSFDQTKDLIWGYGKQYAGAIPGVTFKEGDLEIILPHNGANIKLYGGAAAYERMRGMYFDGIVLDEYPLLNSAVFSSVVRPCLADYRGFAIISGTSNGDDHFHTLKKKNEGKDNWDFHIIPVTSTDALNPDEVDEMTADMTPEEYAREMLCSFDAPIEGSYYGEQLNSMKAKGRVTGVPHDPNAPVFTCWDLGMHDMMPCWFFQICGREIHWIDYYQNNAKDLAHYAAMLDERANTLGYRYKGHIFPHDIKARELGTGVSRYEVLCKLLPPESIVIAPMLAVEDGIVAVRSLLHMSWIDAQRCKTGLSAMQNYHKSKMGRPVHNWASHPADAIRTGCVSFNHIQGLAGASKSGALRRRIRGAG